MEIKYYGTLLFLVNGIIYVRSTIIHILSNLKGMHTITHAIPGHILMRPVIDANKRIE